MRPIQFVKDRPVYFYGYGVSACMFWITQGPKAEGWFDFGMNVVCSLLVGVASWVYPTAKIIIAICA